MVLQCTAAAHKEQQKLCLAAEGFGNRLCFLESTSNSKVRQAFEAICTVRFACGVGVIDGHAAVFWGHVTWSGCENYVCCSLGKFLIEPLLFVDNSDVIIHGNGKVLAP